MLFHLIRRQDKELINQFEDSFDDEQGEEELEENEPDKEKTPLEITVQYEIIIENDEADMNEDLAEDLTDVQLLQMFTTYWGYLMFLNKK